MYTKTWTDQDGTHTETYQSWYNIWWEGWLISGLYLVSGLIGLFATPFVALFGPKQCTMSSSRCHKTSPFESSESLT